MRSFRARRILYPQGNGISLVAFSTPDPREAPSDFLQGLAVRGITRTTTLPDAYGVPPDRLAAVLQACRRRFAGGASAAAAPGADEDLARSRALNGATMVVLTVLLAAGSLWMALGGAGAGAAERAIGWAGVLLFGVGGIAAAVVRARNDRSRRRAGE
jgi:hypothetical protein